MSFINILSVIGLLLALVALWLAVRPKKYTTLFVLVAIVLLPCANLTGQGNCNSIVADTAGMLSGRALQVEQAASGLINQGADIHIVTVPDSKGNLDLIENDIEKSCPSWRNAQGVRKSTLLALLVSRDRKLGVYFGSAWHSALDSHWNRIKTDYMVPRFRDGDYAGGFIAAEEQFTRRLAAAKDEALKPTQTQTINQASDLSGLWTVMILIVIIGAVCVAGYFLFVIVVNNKKGKKAIAAAQQRAQLAFNQASSDIKRLEELIAIKEATGEQVSQRCKDYLVVASQQFDNLANSMSTSPQTNELTESDYDVMEQQYEKVSKAVMVAKSNINVVSVKANEEKEPSKTSGPSKTSESSNPSLSSNRGHQPKPVSYVQPQPPVYTPYPVYVEPTPSVVIINNDSSGSGFDSGGGGSSSWSSSDSSSSSSDSGSSSSWDSGSSDSGGGGSSDF